MPRRQGAAAVSRNPNPALGRVVRVVPPRCATAGALCGSVADQVAGERGRSPFAMAMRALRIDEV
ncbi:hypothetical protein IP88_09960 [alpha proteobacterium AAP81b]|nr:hypothetical protein IP88_09960 [alpha proteobacterium AAP81b]